jgi:putative ABC transport system permease protein
VSEKLARELWGQPAAALGKQVAEVSTGTWREVVGVVANVRMRGLDQEAPSTVYWPVLMSNFYGNADQVSRTVTFAVRSTRTGAAGFLDDLRRAVWDVDRTLPLSQVRTLQVLYERSLARTSFALLMLTLAAGMALLLGIVGIYGVIAYAVSQRRREIGIRIALGAQDAALKRMFVGRGLALAGVGIVIGLAAAFAMTRVMKAMLFGVSAADSVTYVGVALALAAAAAAASYVPARRAVTVDPVESLRAE